jgi:NitT/TauT family transport system ATP-binding protein
MAAKPTDKQTNEALDSTVLKADPKDKTSVSPDEKTIDESVVTAKKPIISVTGPSIDNEPAEVGTAPDVVTFKNVSRIFPMPDGSTFTAIKDVTFSVPDIPNKGEFIAMLGPSGCGKSTVLNIIAGLEPSFPATSGEALVRGVPIKGPGSDRGMVFQSYSSFPCYTVLENVAIGLKFKGIEKEEREDIAMEWIKKVHLSGSEYKYPHQLSGGMRQRVAIARSLVLHPKIILMDEPYGALDRITRWEMQDLLVNIWEEVEATVFLITHDIAEAVYLGDRIYLFSTSPGTIIEEIKVPAPSGRAAEMQRTPEFSALVNEISLKVEKPLKEEISQK